MKYIIWNIDIEKGGVYLCIVSTLGRGHGSVPEEEVDVDALGEVEVSGSGRTLHKGKHMEWPSTPGGGRGMGRGRAGIATAHTDAR